MADEIQAQRLEKTEPAEKLEQDATQKLDDATFEPRAYVEQTGDYKQSEAIQRDFTATVNNSMASAGDATGDTSGSRPGGVDERSGAFPNFVGRPDEVADPVVQAVRAVRADQSHDQPNNPGGDGIHSPHQGWQDPVSAGAEADHSHDQPKNPATEGIHSPKQGWKDPISAGAKADHSHDQPENPAEVGIHSPDQGWQDPGTDGAERGGKEHPRHIPVSNFIKVNKKAPPK
jgi:hypothetical protein